MEKSTLALYKPGFIMDERCCKLELPDKFLWKSLTSHFNKV